MGEMNRGVIQADIFICISLMDLVTIFGLASIDDTREIMSFYIHKEINFAYIFKLNSDCYKFLKKKNCLNLCLYTNEEKY